jgi:hypothetical protein
MSDKSQVEIISMFKWIAIIITLAFAYQCCAPKYYFMKQGNNLLRANKITGKVEGLGDMGWQDAAP